jgi:hypothetical protein
MKHRSPSPEPITIVGLMAYCRCCCVLAPLQSHERGCASNIDVQRSIKKYFFDVHTTSKNGTKQTAPVGHYALVSPSAGFPLI